MYSVHWMAIYCQLMFYNIYRISSFVARAFIREGHFLDESIYHYCFYYPMVFIGEDVLGLLKFTYVLWKNQNYLLSRCTNVSALCWKFCGNLTLVKSIKRLFLPCINFSHSNKITKCLTRFLWLKIFCC